MIVERVKAGLARARALGVTLGRPVVSAKPEDVLSLRDQQLPWSEIARQLGISVSSAKRLAKRRLRGVASGVQPA
jgi:DNA invertase Pin-like site-specific DNA recombinase